MIYIVAILALEFALLGTLLPPLGVALMALPPVTYAVALRLVEGHPELAVEAAGTDRMAMPKAREWLMYGCP